VTFNDYLCGIISNCLKEWYHENGVENPQKIVTFIPINPRNLPTKVEELDLDNKAVGMKFEMPILSELEPAIKQSSFNFKKLVSVSTLMSIMKMTNLFHYLPTI
jgi:hypothetical protein